MIGTIGTKLNSLYTGSRFTLVNLDGLELAPT